VIRTWDTGGASLRPERRPKEKQRQDGEKRRDVRRDSLMDAEMGECPHGEAGAGILPALAFHR
jgi:hypothetical protein